MKLPVSFDRWQEVDVIVSSECLYAEPSVLEVTTYKQWLDAYARWQVGYDAYRKAVDSMADGELGDDFERRLYAHYTGLFYQSGHWHAILLMLLKQVAETERSRHLAEMDGILAGLGEKIARQ
ncbi:MAG TPA: hypothetical protein VGO57_02470 [Verrucomicrobiae bacterium]